MSYCFISKSTPDSAIMPRRWRKLLGCLALVFGLAAAGPAAAHGFGQRYDLPLPLSFYIWGAGATVAVSFVGFALFLRAEHGLLTCHVDWRAKGRLVGALAAVPRALASAMLLLVIVAGLFGNQDPIRNIAPVMIWIIGWVGLAFLSVLLGDVWRLVNPWNAVFALAELCCRRVRADAVLGFARRYPEHFGNGLFPVLGEISQQRANHRRQREEGWQRRRKRKITATRCAALRKSNTRRSL
jgi:hypothetical protein